MAEYVSYESPVGPRMFKFGKFSFSSIEIRHLSIALVMITLALMALRRDAFFVIGPVNFILMYFFTVGLGFLLHELGHKLVAQHYGFISEFRADFLMMTVAIFMAFSGFLFLAPGAVMILGRPTLKQNGIISVAGPLVNLALASIFAVIAVLFSPDPNSLLGHIIFLGIWINAFLGLFNMLPFWVLDGKKVLAWSRQMYFSVLLGLIFFLVGSFSGWFI